MQNYLERFTEMVDALKQHPDVVVTHFETGNPASSRKIIRAERAVGQLLSEEIAAFYQNINGLQLRWQWKKSPHYSKDAVPDGDLTIDSVIEDGGQAAGCINLLPIELAMGHDDSWEEVIWFKQTKDTQSLDFGGEDYPARSFRRRIKPFDYYHFYYCVSHVFYPLKAEPTIALGSDYHAAYSPFGIQSFADYLNFLLSSYGLVSARRDLGDWHDLNSKDGVEKIVDLDRLVFDPGEDIVTKK